jgi:RES domain-containing protein
MLEKLVNGSGRLPPGQHYIEITIPNGTSYEMLDTASLPDWYRETAATSKIFGDAWQKERRSLILIVPSIAARVEKNILINPEHPDFPRITTSLRHNNQRRLASILPPSTVTTAAVVLLAVASQTKASATSSAVTSRPSRFALI